MRTNPWTPARFDRQIDRLHARFLLTPEFYDRQQRGVSLAAFVRHKQELSYLLARIVARGEYQMAAAQVRRVRLGEKQRTIFSLRLTDLLVHGVVAQLTLEAIAPRFSPRLYSYRKGRSWWNAIGDLAAYLQQHRRERPDPRQRGVYVVRRDIKSYTDSIPVGDGSAIWSMLRSALEESNTLSNRDWELIRSVIRPESCESDGRPYMLSRGVPTGLPIACVLFNLYLAPLDEALDSIPGGFYARYSDDILFAHPSAAVVQAAAQTIDRITGDLGLTISADKRRDLYVTAAGRRSDEWPEARPAMSVPLLGCRVSAQATISLSRNKLRRLLHDIERRAARTAATCRHADTDATGRSVSAVVNRSLIRRADPFHIHTADLLRSVVTDREQLRQIDYWIARIVLRLSTGRGGAQMFRTIPYRRIRRDWKLRSLVHARNRAGRQHS